MRDIKLMNGDVLMDSCGRPVVLEGSKARLQSAEIISTVEKGSFIYNRELGADIASVDSDSEDADGRMELVINEALARYGDIYARVTTNTDGSKIDFFHREV